MKINCDIGERGAVHPVDTELMRVIGIANIACGGHAGDAQSIAAFLDLARQHHVQVAAHLSYPDRSNFGRLSMALPMEALLASLDEQYDAIGRVKTVKLHGALYNDCWVKRDLAEALALWLRGSGAEEVITPFDSELAVSCRNLGLAVLPEAFAERRYTIDPQTGRLVLVSRKKAHASIHEVDEAFSQSVRIIREGTVEALFEEEATLVRRSVPIRAETICIHSDSDIALDLARRLAPFQK